MRAVDASEPAKATEAATAAAENGHRGADLLASLTDPAMSHDDVVRFENALNNIIQLSSYLGALGYPPGPGSKDLPTARHGVKSLTSFESELPGLLAKYESSARTQSRGKE